MYSISRRATALSIVAFAAQGLLATVALANGQHAAAYLLPDGSVNKVAVPTPWSEAVGLCGAGQVAVNTQITTGITRGMILPGTSPDRKPAPNHTAAKILHVEPDGTAYGWSVGKVGGRTTYCAAVWLPSQIFPQIIYAANTHALGPAPDGGVYLRVLAMNGATGSLLILKDGVPHNPVGAVNVVGAVAVGGGEALGAWHDGTSLHPFLVGADGVVVNLPTPAGSEGAVPLCASGNLIGGYAVEGTTHVAVLWDRSGGTLTVNKVVGPADLLLRNVQAIDPNGSIAGLANDAANVGLPPVAYVGTMPETDTGEF